MSWALASLRANGVRDDLPWDECLNVLEILVATGRTIPANKWVDWMIANEQRAALDHLI
jgi:hypothetical protein